MAADPKPDPSGSTSPVEGELAWLRALARRLARDPSEADDLVQETWLAADRARAAEARAPRAWLGGVLRNRERMLRRGEARRRWREGASVEVREHEDAELSLHRHRILSSVQDALRELDESDRSLLLARYCDGYDAAELGLRLGIPASTVRSRLSRATARVRRNLDERWGGDRGAWAPAVLAIPLPRRAGVPLATSTGGLLMSVVMNKLTMVLLVVVLGGTGIWLGVTRWGGGEDERSATGETHELGGGEVTPPPSSRVDEPGRSGVVLGGRVVEAETGAPVPGAVVIVAPTLGGSMVSTQPGHAAVVPRAIADADGRFVLDGLPMGRYGLTAAAPGHLPTRVPSTVVMNATSDLVISLRTGGNRVEGTVTDITGGPVEGELVRAQPPGDAVTGPDRAGYGAVTDADGHYVLSVPDGAWTIVAGGEDYTKETRRISVKRGPGRADFVLVPGGSIHGRVIDRATGEPVADAAVDFAFHMRIGSSWTSNRSQQEETTRTDAEGRFELRPLASGDYTLHAAAPGRASADEPVVHVAIAEQVTDVVLAVDPAFDAAGFVVDAENPERGLPDVEVTAFAGSENGRWFAVTGPDGSFRLSGMPKGAYMLDFVGGGVIPSGLEHTLRIENGDLEGARYELARGVLLKGRVQPALAGEARVRGRAETGGFEVMLQARKVQNAKARIAEDGTFSIEGVPPGEWKIVATADDGSQGSVEIDVPKDGLADVQIPLVARPQVAGVVQDFSGAPVPGITVNLQAEPDPSMPPGPWRRPKTVGSAVSRADGTFEVLGVGPGHYTVSLQDGRAQTVPMADDEEPPIVEPEIGRDVTDLVLRVRLPDGRIDGVVRDAAGEVVPDAWVQARVTAEFDSRTEHTLAAITDAEGRFALEGLAPGEYHLDVRGPDADARGSAEKVTIGQSVTITVEDFGAIEGKVVRDGRPLTEFRLDSGEGDARRVIDADGRFVLERLPPGEQTVAVTTDEGSASATVDVKSGEVESVVLDVHAWGSLEGVVVSAVDGAPLEGLTIGVRSESGVREASESMVSSFLGTGGNQTDASGRFSVEGVGGGRVTISFSKGAFGRGEEELGVHVVELPPGEHLDVGTIVALPPVGVPPAERGTLGIDVDAGVSFPVDYSERGDDRHVWVAWVAPGGPAERAGLKVGDRVTAIDGIEVDAVGWRTLVEAFSPSRVRAGQRYALEVERGGKSRTLHVRAAAKAK